MTWKILPASSLQLLSKTLIIANPLSSSMPLVSNQKLCHCIGLVRSVSSVSKHVNEELSDVNSYDYVTLPLGYSLDELPLPRFASLRNLLSEPTYGSAVLVRENP